MASENVIQWEERFYRDDKPLPRWQTPLREKLSQEKLDTFANYLDERISTHFTALGAWRKNQKRFEKRMADCMGDRISGEGTKDEGGGLRRIFELSNESLNVVGGFADFAFAQARTDLFGSEPYFRAKPEGVDDGELGDLINKHANWKLGSSNVSDGMIEALELAFHLGTAFPKATWRRSEEKYERDAVVLTLKGEPVLSPTGGYYHLGEEAPEGVDPEAAGEYAYQRMRVEEREVYYDNAEIHCIHHNDIAWDITAPELELQYTPVFHRVNRRVLDLAAEIDADKVLVDELMTAATTNIIIGGDGETGEKEHFEEQRPEGAITSAEHLQNPEVMIVECFDRVDLLETGDPVRVFAYYCPALKRVLFVDYLARVTPKGVVPIKPVRIYKVAGRVYGRGFHEKYENVQDYIDANYNAATYNNAMNRTPRQGIDVSKLERDLEEEEEVDYRDPNKIYKLKSGESMKQAFQFADPPPDSDKSIELASLMMELTQLRTGISSASQGEMSQVGGSDTATGIRQLMSRSAVLLKWPIDQSKKDLTKGVEVVVSLLYANHDHAETFTWGDGQSAEVLTLSPEQVRGLSMNVRFEMVQAQNEAVLETNQGAISLMQAYVNLPEFEKGPMRPLFVRGLSGLDVENPEAIVRQPVLTFEDLLTQLPPELAQMLAQNSPAHAEMLMQAEATQ